MAAIPVGIASVDAVLTAVGVSTEGNLQARTKETSAEEILKLDDEFGSLSHVSMPAHFYLAGGLELNVGLQAGMSS